MSSLSLLTLAIVLSDNGYEASYISFNGAEKGFESSPKSFIFHSWLTERFLLVGETEGRPVVFCTSQKRRKNIYI